jgi:hypothetical protein
VARNAKKPTDRFIRDYRHGHGHFFTDTADGRNIEYGPYETADVAEFHRAKRERDAANERARRGAR